MKQIVDSAGEARRAWLRGMQDDLMPLQSDFEKSPAFRLSLIVAAVVVGLSLFAPEPASSSAHVAVRATV